MKFISLPTFSNREDFEINFRFKDADNGSLITLNASTDDIVFEVRSPRDISILVATLDNGKITIAGTGVATVAFPRSEMTGIEPEQYTYGLTFSRSGETVQIAKGQITITGGIVGA